MGNATGLAGRLAADVDRAFPELVLTYQDRLYSGVRSFVGTADAGDVTQEAFIRAHKALHGYDGDRIEALQVSPWLWTIAINLCRNWARTRSRRPQTVQLKFDQAGGDSAADDALNTVVLDEWKQRLAGLSEPQRTAVVLRHVVGLSYREIASVTDRPVGTAKTDVSRGLTALRKIISEEGTP
jgi:RNA polymerase sigma-70 factor (ECF subfamily)